MIRSRTVAIACCTALVLCISSITGITAYAGFDSLAAASPADTKADNHKHYLEDAVERLVQEGKLTKEKGNSILEYKKQRSEEFSKLSKEERQKLKKECKKGSLLKELKEKDIITDKEAQLIKEKLHQMKEERLNTGLQGLVDKGVLTATDIDNIRSYMLKVREERKAVFEKLKSMTPEEREAYFKEHKGERKDILKRMVEDKVITSKQADEIRKAIPELSKERHKLH
jgi:hypothetical protein